MKNGMVRVYYPKDAFNSLVEVLEYFCRSEKNYGENYYSVHAKKLKVKMMCHARPFESKNGKEYAAVYYFEREVALLIKLLGDYISLAIKPSEDAYAQIKKRKEVSG